MSDPKIDAKAFENPTWLYADDGEARLFAAGEKVPAKGWADHPPASPEAPKTGSAALAADLASAQVQVETLTQERDAAVSRAEAAEAALAKFDKDGFGKPGGAPKPSS